jgi:hypothetical protein
MEGCFILEWVGRKGGAWILVCMSMSADITVMCYRAGSERCRAGYSKTDDGLQVVHNLLGCLLGVP